MGRCRERERMRPRHDDDLGIRMIVAVDTYAFNF